MTDLDRFGTFSSPGYISIGDDYAKKTTGDDRYKGKQMLTNPGKKGKTKDVTISRDFNPLLNGDPYVDAVTFERQRRAAEKKRNLTDKPFLPTSPPKRNSGLGSLYGTIGPRPEYQREPPREPTRAASTKPAPRNMLTNPSKRGSYGTPGTLIGGAEYSHQEDPYMPRPPRPTTSAKCFKTMHHGNRTFDGNSCYTTDSKCITRRAAESRRSPPPKPFVPSSPNKSGKLGTFERFPEYKETPYNDRPTRPPVSKVFKPPSRSCKSSPTRSIALYGLNSSVSLARSQGSS